MAEIGRTQKRAARGSPRQKRTESDTQEAQGSSSLHHSEKDGILERIRERLRDPVYFPHLQNIRDFAESLGFHGVASGKREQVVRALVKDLSTRDTTELNTILHRLTRPKDINDLSAWSDLIISKEGQK